ncbi:hypothetical protein BAUCODRAFT_35964 [Baudoinia panamericana UAMH 10762]|uniref:Spc7 kinetochore protein domain-containing protein n=1 Tax=Baudoinia panamericana (strain UAMH 10762) TaxID=717646 RepID=M2LKC9_BAUPA|nr:uncharacterized protein BAUCODRAFT_35964 [Baudoinia panamericana UAMH 10762]EMC94722.1 hypothetical protein BAUCODRAFT_35964 [Baudoinia panamericana UAMH 10762]
MAEPANKENVAPYTSSDPLQLRALSPAKKAGRKGRSKSIGPGDLVSSDGPKQELKKELRNRRKSTFVPATKSILSGDAEAERKAARRRTLANRRVSFAPEATLHTWDVIEFMRDQTTSTDSSDPTRRQSNITRSEGEATPFQRSAGTDFDIEEPPSTPPEQEDEPSTLPASPAPQRDLHRKQRRRSSGSSPAVESSPDEGLPEGRSGSSDASGSEDDEEVEDLDDVTGTAMSLDIDEATGQSSESGSSTSSSLTQRLRQAAETAGTRGIEYDEEYESTVSMEIAGEGVKDASKPWAPGMTAETVGSASLDQENVNPFSPAFKAQMTSGLVRRPSTIAEEDTGEMSMDVTRAVGGILRSQAREVASSPVGGDTMEFTQAVGRIYQAPPALSTSRVGQKRRQSTTDAGSPQAPATVLKRSRRSSVARSSMGDDTMDLTVAVGGIQKQATSPKVERRRSVARRRSSAATILGADEATMDFTQAVGGIRSTATRAEHTASSFDENEELTMELTTVLGGIGAADMVLNHELPSTPKQAQSPLREAANTTPKDQERFKDAPDSGPKKLLTPVFQKQVSLSAEKSASAEREKRRRTISPGKVSWTGAVFDEEQRPEMDAKDRFQVLEEPVSYPALTRLEEKSAPKQATPTNTPPSVRVNGTPVMDFKQELHADLLFDEPAKKIEETPRLSPRVAAATPEKPADSQKTRNTLANSIRLMSTPRKETLKAQTPKKQPISKAVSPIKAMTPRPRAMPTSKLQPKTSPARQLSNDLIKPQSSDEPVEKVHLQDFLDQAGIRFMDITATKRRLTTAPTPSKARKDSSAESVTEEATSLETAIVTAACTQPEHDMFQHACHELKHYISEGKKLIKQLEAETYQDCPPLIHAYRQASPERKAALDAQMREMKTNARLRSKEMWYAWRTQLLEDLMKGLSGIGEGLLRDDEVLQRTEKMLQEVLPELVERQQLLQDEAETLEQAAEATSEEEKVDLETARVRLSEAEGEVEEKQKMLAELQQAAEEQVRQVGDLQESKAEFAAAIKEAERVREACRGVSMDEIAALKDSVRKLEETYGWTIASASSATPTATMTYKSQLQLFFHPAAFQVPSSTGTSAHTKRPNAPISLLYIAQDRNEQPKELTTTLRFFLQLLRASLQALPQCTTRVADLLGLVGSGWGVALQVAEAERRLHLETLTDARIVSDERLAIDADLLLPKVRTKVRVSFQVQAAVGDGLRLSTTITANAVVVYGEQYNESKMSKFVLERSGGMAEGWAIAVRELREKLLATGAKGFRK